MMAAVVKANGDEIECMIEVNSIHWIQEHVEGWFPKVYILKFTFSSLFF